MGSIIDFLSQNIKLETNVGQNRIQTLERKSSDPLLSFVIVIARFGNEIYLVKGIRLALSSVTRLSNFT